MSKRYWIPILMGAGAAVIGFLITYADLTLYLGVNAKTGVPLGVAMVMLDRLAASLVVVFLYRNMCVHIKRLPLMMLFWAVTIWAYYVISYNIELISGCILTGKSIIEAYQNYGFWAVMGLFFSLEPPFTYVFSVLILLSIPPRFCKPLWVSPNGPAVEETYVLNEDRA